MKREDAVGNKQGARLSAGCEAACHAETDQSATASRTCKLAGRRRTPPGGVRDALQGNLLAELFVARGERLLAEARTA